MPKHFESRREKERMNIIDILKQSRRMPQIILPKDAAMIVAYTGVTSNWDVLDSGTGSGFISMFLANIVMPGKVVSYEINGTYAKNAQENAKRAGLSNLQIINKDIFTAPISGKFDLITLDLKNSDRLINKVYKVLKKGGWLAVYSPHIEQVKAVRKEIEKKELQFTDILTIEAQIKEWQVTEDYSHPVPSGLIHTGFLTFARKAV
jgi:tRNA (adenine57-N1/adenine58-N1)-methyltransferase